MKGLICMLIENTTDTPEVLRKVGILTFHKSPNYGALLQTFALYQFIKSNYKDCKVSILDFKCKGNSDEYCPEKLIDRLSSSKFAIVRYGKRFLLKSRFKKKYDRKYESFNEFTSEHLSVCDGALDCYDCVFLGSDQIWNPHITGGFQDAYFGLDERYKARIKASYAASCGNVSDLSSEEISILIKNLHNLDYVGVREKSLCDVLYDNGIDSCLTMDPTFLFEKDEYIKMLNIPLSTEKYILEYALQYSKELDELADSISKKKGVKVIRLCGYADPYTRHMAGQRLFDAGPKEFLRLISNADHIVTNSFHGVAFSIIFRKSFNVVLPAVRQSRILDLVTSLGLEDRVYDNRTVNTYDIDYSIKLKILEEKVKESKRYINKVMERVNSYE